MSPGWALYWFLTCGESQIQYLVMRKESNDIGTDPLNNLCWHLYQSYAFTTFLMFVAYVFISITFTGLGVSRIFGVHFRLFLPSDTNNYKMPDKAPNNKGYFRYFFCTAYYFLRMYLVGLWWLGHQIIHPHRKLKGITSQFIEIIH